MISVITPVYNGKRFIEFCINNVIEQKCSDVEHIIIDGGSSDGTVEIIEKYAARYDHLRWVSEKDRGQSDALNKGIAMARGFILGVLNVDDYYEPNVLPHILEKFRILPEPALLVGNCNLWDDNGHLLFVNKPSKINLSNLLLRRFSKAYPMNPSAYFCHLSIFKVIGLYKIDDHYAMDLDFILRAVQLSFVQYSNETWGNYRHIEGTKTYDDKKSGNDSLRVTTILDEYIKKLSPFQRYKIYFLRNLENSFIHLKIFIKMAIRA